MSRAGGCVCTVSGWAGLVVGETYLAPSYWCSMQRFRKLSLWSSCRAGLSHFLCDLRNKAKALPLVKTLILIVCEGHED